MGSVLPLGSPSRREQSCLLVNLFSSVKTAAAAPSWLGCSLKAVSYHVIHSNANDTPHETLPRGFSWCMLSAELVAECPTTVKLKIVCYSHGEEVDVFKAAQENRPSRVSNVKSKKWTQDSGGRWRLQVDPWRHNLLLYVLWVVPAPSQDWSPLARHHWVLIGQQVGCTPLPWGSEASGSKWYREKAVPCPH